MNLARLACRYHFPCINLTEEQALNIASYYCAICEQAGVGHTECELSEQNNNTVRCRAAEPECMPQDFSSLHIRAAPTVWLESDKCCSSESRARHNMSASKRAIALKSRDLGGFIALWPLLLLAIVPLAACSLLRGARFFALSKVHRTTARASIERVAQLSSAGGLHCAGFTGRIPAAANRK